MKFLNPHRKFSFSVSFLSVLFFDGSRKNMTHCKQRLNCILTCCKYDVKISSWNV